MSKDPVCGMEVHDERFCSTYKGMKYCFCSSSCMKKFKENPSRYVEAEK